MLANSTPEKLPEIRTRTKPLHPIVGITAGLNSALGSIAVPILLTVFKAMRDMDKRISIPLLLAAWGVAGTVSFWMDWNKLKERLPREFRLTFYTNGMGLLEPSTIAFHFIEDVLHYHIEVDGENSIEFNLNGLSKSPTEKIKNGNLHELAPNEHKEIKTLVKVNGHKPRELPDMELIPGNRTDNWLFLKCFGSLVIQSSAAGALLGLSIAKDKGLGLQITSGFVVACLNTGNAMLREPPVGAGAHLRSGKHKDNPKPLHEQPGFWLIFNPYVLGFMKNVSPFIVSAFSTLGISQALGTIGLPSWAANTLALCFYPPMVSGLGTFTLTATKALIDKAGMPFDINHSWAEDAYLWPVAEILRCRYSTIDGPLRAGFSPITISNALVGGIVLGAVALLYSPIRDFLFCPDEQCLQGGGASLLTFVISQSLLESNARSMPTLYLSLFLVVLAIPLIAAAISTWSQRANIVEFVEERKRVINGPIEKDIENQVDNSSHVTRTTTTFTVNSDGNLPGDNNSSTNNNTADKVVNCWAVLTGCTTGDKKPLNNQRASDENNTGNLCVIS